MDLEPVFMVRDASFGANFTPKLVLSLLTVGLVAWDMAGHRRRDYLWVFAAGTVIWTLVESALHLLGTRVMPVQLLFGTDIPLAAAVLLQGIAEGAFVAVLGLFVADRVRGRSTRATALLGFALGLGIMWLLMAIQAARPQSGAQAAGSHRDMTELSGLVFLLVIVGCDVWFWVRRPAFRARSLTMFAVMVAFGTVWTLADVSTGGRWVELGGTAAGTFAAAPPLASFLAFAFDVVVEIAAAYVPFFAIPALMGLISPERPHERAPAGRNTTPA